MFEKTVNSMRKQKRVRSEFIWLLVFLFWENTLSSQSLKSEYYQCALENYDMANYEKAIEYFNGVIEINPEDSMAYFDRAMAKEMMRDYNGAISDYTKQLKIDVNMVDCYFLRGIMLLKTDHNPQAIEDFDRTLNIEAENSDAYYYRSVAEFNLHEMNRAQLDCDRAIQLNNSNNLYFLQKAKIYLSLNKRMIACNAFKKYIELGGKSSETQSQLYCK